MLTRQIRHFGEHLGALRQVLQRRPAISFAASHAEPPDRPFLVEPGEQVGDRRVDLGKAVERAVGQPPEQPALDHENRLLDLGFVRGRRGLAGRIAVS